MSSIACFLFDLKGVLYVIENIIHFKKSTNSWPELKIYLIWSICIKKLNKVFSDKITSAGSLHFSTFHYILIVSLPVCKNFFPSQIRLQDIYFFLKSPVPTAPPPPAPDQKSNGEPLSPTFSEIVGVFLRLRGEQRF